MAAAVDPLHGSCKAASCFSHGVPSLEDRYTRYRDLRPLQGEGVTIILLIELVQEHCLGSWWTDVVNTLHSSLFWPWCSESVPSFEDRYTGTGTLAFTR